MPTLYTVLSVVSLLMTLVSFVNFALHRFVIEQRLELIRLVRDVSRKRIISCTENSLETVKVSRLFLIVNAGILVYLFILGETTWVIWVSFSLSALFSLLTTRDLQRFLDCLP